jgi:hypothetical protein
MIKLENQMTLYHGSYCEVRNPDLSMCAKDKDFGRGFYLTSSREQAVSFLKTSIAKAASAGIIPEDQDYGYVSVFTVNNTDDLGIKIFETADREWLHCIASHRKTTIFKEVKKQLSEFDVIGGKIADDMTNITLVTYINGAFGVVGSDEADSLCIGRLLPERLKDQFCFRSNKALCALEFVQGDKIWLNK